MDTIAAKKAIKKFIFHNVTLYVLIIIFLIPPLTFIGLILIFVLIINLRTTQKSIAKLEDSGTLEKAAAEMMSANARYLIKGNVIFTENYIFCKRTGLVLRYDEILWAYKHRHTSYTIVADQVLDSLALAVEGMKKTIDAVTISKDKDHEIEIAILEIYRHNKHCLIGYTDENIRKYKEMIK